MADVTSIVAEFGAYYLNHGQNKKDLVKQLYYKSETDSIFTRRTTQDTVLRLSETSFARILQPFQKQFTPISGAVFKGITIPLYRMKIDFEEYPDTIADTWAAFLQDKNLDRRKWPLIKWLLEEHIIPQSEEDYELNEVYSGEHAAPVAGTAGAAGTAMNGIKTLINAGVSASSITPIVTGAPDADPVLFMQQIEAFCASIDKRYWKMGMEVNLSQELHLRYRQGKRKFYNMYYAQEKELDTVADFPNMRVAGRPSMAGSTKWFATPRWNAICGVKHAANRNVFEVEKQDRKVKIYTDWYKGIGFAIPELVYTNDQELPVA